jgi:hypothetical protein
LQKKSFKKSFVWKSCFGEKGHAKLIYTNACGSFESHFDPHTYYTLQKNVFLKCEKGPI